MMSYFYLIVSVVLFQTVAFAQDPTKPTPDPNPSIDEILNTLDCAGTIEGKSARLKPGAPSDAQDEFNIEVVTTHPTFAKNLVVVGSNTTRDQYIVLGNDPTAFTLSIDKFGVHGAHNAALEFPLSPGERYSFECYFY
jgi:hypothetical protein